MASTTPDQTKLEFTTFYNVIDGKLEKGTETRHTVNPSTLEANPELPISTRDDVNRAVKAAQRAAKEWAQVPLSVRQKAVADFGAAMEAHTQEFVQMAVWEQGKPPIWGAGEFATGVAFLKGTAKMSLPDETIDESPARHITTRYTPLGVAVGIVSWNFPIFLSSGKAGAALVTGNAFILKPSPFAPYSCLKMAELAMRFFPPGVFQALSGDEDLGPLLTLHPDVDMISFTGSTPTGKAVMKACSNTLKRVTLELGGNDPAIVCADVDLAAAVAQIAVYTLLHAGQMCMAIKRVYVHESIYDEFLAAFVAYINALPTGVEETAFVGPVSNEEHYKRVRKMLEEIEDQGFTVVTGGLKSLPDRKGFYLPPTIINNPPESSAVVQEEQFAPIIPIMKWSDEDDVIQRANGTGMGLGASVWSVDEANAERIARRIQSGSVWINTHGQLMPDVPFSGHKMSGYNTEYGSDGLKAFCNVQAIIHKK